jgi:hypothetical protein
LYRYAADAGSVTLSATTTADITRTASGEAIAAAATAGITRTASAAATGGGTSFLTIS